MLFTTSWIADLLLIAILSILCGHIFRQIQKKIFSAFDPLIFFWIGVFVIYLIEGISNFDKYAFYYGEEVIEITFFWIFLGLLFLHFGYRLQKGKKLAEKIPNLPEYISPNKMLSLSILLTMIGTAGWIMQIQSAGGLLRWAATPRGGEDWEQLSGYVAQLSGMLTVGLTLFLFHVEMHRRSFLMRFMAWLLISLLLIFFFYLGSRSRIIGITVVMFMAWGLIRRRNPSLIITLPAIFIIFFLVNFQAEYRDNFRDFSLNLDKINLSEVPVRVLPKFITGEISTKPFTLSSEFGMTAAVVKFVPEKISYALGGEFLQIFTHPIPRAIWREKPYPRGELWSEVHLQAGTSEWWVVQEVSKPYLAGPAPGYIASWYYNGGFFGLLIGGILTGIFLRALRGLYDRSRNNESYLVLYVVMAPTGFGEAVSHPFNWVYALPIVLIPLFLLLKISRR